MIRIKLLVVSLSFFTSVIAQNTLTQSGPAFTRNHRSVSVLYGPTPLFNAAPFIKKSHAPNSEGSFGLGSLSLLYNQAISNNISINVGPTAMYYRDRYRYNLGIPEEGTVNLYFGGATMGFNYHIPSVGRVDPYIGAAGGVGYFWGRGGADQLGRRLKGVTSVLYSGKVGLNVYNRSNNAWTFEAGYDYLSYLKIGYSWVKRK